jgi:hypothetical protein
VDTVHHAVDVCIDPDIGHIIEDREDDFRGLHSDPREALYEAEVIRDDAIVFLGNDSSCLFDVAWFIVKKIHISQISLDLAQWEGDHISCFSYFREKWRRDPIHLLIRRLSREDDRTEELERCLIVELYTLPAVESIDRIDHGCPGVAHV